MRVEKYKMKQFILGKKQIFLFVIAGGLSAVVEIVMMKVFSHYIPQFFPQETNFFGIKYLFSNILSTGCAVLFNYWLSIRFVFERGKHGKKREFAYFVGISFVSTLLSLTFFQLFINFVFHTPLDLIVYALSPIMMSKIMAIALVSILNYFVKKNVIFKG